MLKYCNLTASYYPNKETNENAIEVNAGLTSKNVFMVDLDQRTFMDSLKFIPIDMSFYFILIPHIHTKSA